MNLVLRQNNDVSTRLMPTATAIEAGAVAWTLSRGALHVTDASNAGVTGMLRADASDWSPDLLATLRVPEKVLPRVASLWNMYGPTETTVWSTLHQVRRNSPNSLLEPFHPSGPPQRLQPPYMTCDEGLGIQRCFRARPRQF